MTIIVDASFISAFKGQSSSYSNFLQVVYSSPLLKSIFENYSCTLQCGASGAGTATTGYGNSAVITFDPQTIAQFANPQGLPGLADALPVTMLFITHALPKNLQVDEIVQIGAAKSTMELSMGALGASVTLA